ncbi:TRAP transporter T-component [Desulforhopalus singaporensis]|uniref:TRAP transporter T-component n=2 Tax=Desulforhopalus singaporensis TaxID=91360 RepID=A0A1H0TUN5_9BACT|nr:TRAP transporter T-component [Desulforhopalus singaporensis]
MPWLVAFIAGSTNSKDGFQMMRKNTALFFGSALLLVILGGCSSLVNRHLIQPTLDNLQQQTDIDLVCEGAPAYLLMLDSLLVSSPTNRGLLLSAVQAYTGYSEAFESCNSDGEERISAITEKAKRYGKTLLAMQFEFDGSDQKFDRSLSRTDTADVPALFWGAMGWLTWVKSQQGSPTALADLVYLEKIMQRLLVLAPGYQGGSVHLFWGVYYAAKPKMLGGRPELSRMHFEQALAASDRRFLMVQTSYAETYARSTMNRELHDALLEEVVSFPVDSAAEYGLSNHLAQRRAKKLLEENYFGD